MRIAVISDIHGNAVALEAVLADLERYPADQIVCLGDAIQGGPQPAEVVNSLRTLGCPVVMGNADAWLLTGTDSVEPTSEAQETMRQWSLTRLDDADRQFIAAFVPTVSISLPGGNTLLAFHGSPTSYDDVLLPETPYAEFVRVYGPSAPAILTGGHTHLQHIRRLGDTFYFNPGSIGNVSLAYEVQQAQLPEPEPRLDPRAEYAVLEVTDERVALEFRRVPFEVEALLHVVQAAGCPPSRERWARVYGMV